MIDTIIFFFLLTVIFLYGVYRSGIVRTEESYLLADRNTSLAPLVATLVMTEFNPSTLVGFSALGYLGGYWALSFPLVFLIGLIFYTFAVASKWKRLNASSVSELFSLRYGEDLGKIASVFLILAMLGFSANYIKSMQIIFNPFFHSIHPTLLSFLLVGIVLLITLRGGLVSIIKADTIGFLITIVLLPSIYFFSTSDSYPISISISEGMKTLPFSFVLSLVVLTMFTYIAAPWYGQKIFSAKNEKTAFLAVGISAFLVFLLYGFPVLAVYNLKRSGIVLENPDKAISYIFNHLFPQGFKGFGYLVVLTAGVTTLSGVWSAMSTMILTDFGATSNRKEFGYQRGMLITVFLAVISFVLSETFIDKILDKLILANVPIASLAFGLLGAFYWEKASRTGVYISLIFGLFWGSFCYLYFGEAGGYTFYWGVVGIPIFFIIGIIFSLLFPPSANEVKKIQEFQERMKDSSRTKETLSN
ncbi:MAG: hypothetical protein KDK54_19110 [Leptospiraceae bacterium]|nr:hypothetical protein [Leptospiraceae bacterium]